MNLARRPLAFPAVLLVAGVLGAGVAFAATGDQDPSFNGGAPRLIDFPGTTHDNVTQLAIGPDGSIVIAGTIYGEDRIGVGLARLNASGEPVTTFGDQGTLTDFSVDRLYRGPTALAVAADGDILVGLSAQGAAPEAQPLSWGSDYSSVEADLAVARYGADGTFEGVSRVELPGILATAQIVAIEPRADGGALVLGSTRIDEWHGSFVRVLLDADGNLDPSLGGDGIATDDSVDADAFAASAQDDGSVVIAGNQSDAGGSVLRRYHADGSVDATYGGNVDFASAVFMFGGDVLEDGSVLAVDNDAVRRFTAAGKLDDAYGEDGTGDLSFASSPVGEIDIAAQPDHKAVVIARQGDHVVVARLTADGQPDATFGTDGKVVLPRPDGMVQMFPGGVAIQPGGEVVAAGYGGKPAPAFTTFASRAVAPDERQAFVIRLDDDPAMTVITDRFPPQPTGSTTTITPDATRPVAVQGANPLPAARSCVSRRSFKIRLRIPRGAKAVKATVKVNGKQVKVIKGSRVRAAIDLRGLPKRKAKVSVTVTLADGSILKGTRTYRTCTSRRGGDTPKR